MGSAINNYFKKNLHFLDIIKAYFQIYLKNKMNFHFYKIK
jgi:hypothetical protein